MKNATGVYIKPIYFNLSWSKNSISKQMHIHMRKILWNHFGLDEELSKGIDTNATDIDCDKLVEI